MNQLVTTLLMAFSLINGSSGAGNATFCEVPTISSVFNIGKTIHFLRCGQVWTYNPSLYTNSGRGGFSRDYTWFNFAKEHLGRVIALSHNEVYSDDHLVYTGFSIQGLECKDWNDDLERDCDVSAHGWNTLSMIASNHSVLIFRYGSEIKFTSDDVNPWGMEASQIVHESNKTNLKRHSFWPYLHKIAPLYGFKDEYPSIASLLFMKEDFRLFVVLWSPDLNYKCITHINMRQMLLDINHWPKYKVKDYEYKWAPAKCWTGNIVGMFQRDGEAYIVGRITENRQFEDQVYTMTASDNSLVDIKVINIPGIDFPYNLRTFFGCPITESWYKPPPRTRPTGSSKATTEPPSGAPPLTPNSRNRRPKRSVEEKEPQFALIWRDIVTEIKEDWIQLSLMSSLALFLIYRLFKYF